MNINIVHYTRLFNVFLLVLSTVFLLVSCESKQATNEVTPPLKALIIDGQNNHGGWPETSAMMHAYLEETGLFSVDIYRARYTWQGPHNDGSYGSHEAVLALLETYPADNLSDPVRTEEPQPDPDFAPRFADYDVVISNFGWKASSWPQQTKIALEQYLTDGGGLVIVHAANNSFGDWDAFNQMIGLGGWGGRSQLTGPYVYYDNQNNLVRDTSDGPCGGHGPQAEFALTTRAPEHPIMTGLPMTWMHTKDELYDRLRGPAENMTVLATAYSDVQGNAPDWDKSVSGTGRHEPMLMTVDYGKGRVFHTALGHTHYSFECVGFITTLQRGAEWAATGTVTIPVPENFPSADLTSKRQWGK